MAVVTISREYGAGGINIARQLAQKRGWPFIFREELIEECRKRGVDIDLERIEGRPPGFIERFLGMNRQDLPAKLKEIMAEAADAGNAVIGGWGGQVLLGDRADAVHLRIVGPMENRIRHLMDTSGMSRSVAEEAIRRADRGQRLFAEYFFNADFADTKFYHAVFNMEQAGPEEIVSLIETMLAHTLPAAS